MSAPDRLIGSRSRPAHRQERRALRQPLGLHEQIPERRVRAVGVRLREHNLQIARELDLAHSRGMIRYRDLSHFGRLARSNGDLHYRLDIVVPAMERHAVARESHAIPGCFRADRLMTRRPHAPRRYIAQIAPLAMIISGAVVAPPVYGKVPVATHSGACVAYYGRVGNVAEQCDARLRTVRGFEFAHGRLLSLRGDSHRLVLLLHVLQYESSRNSLLQYQLCRPHDRI